MLKLAIENSKFRNFLVFRIFNGIGSGIFAIFMMWAVHAQYQNPFYTGLAGFMFAVAGVANFIVGPFVDKHNKVMLMRVACFVQLCIVGLLLATSLFFTLNIWLLLFMILIFDGAVMIVNPAGTALLPKIVSSEDLMRANSFIGIIATIAGLIIGTFLYFTMARGVGFELIYAVNTVFLAVALIITIFMQSVESKSEIKSDKNALKNYFAELKTGFAFVSRGAVLYLTISAIFTAVFANAAAVNLPMLAEVHAGAASGYILLMALGLVGGIIGYWIVGIVSSKFEVWKIFAAGSIFMGISRIIFVNVIADNFTRALWLFVLYAGLGGAIGILTGTLMQKLPPQNIIARVNTVRTSLIAASAAIGALIGGVAGTLIPNVDMIFVIQGALYIVIGLCICLPKQVRELPKIGDVTPIDESADSGYN